MKKTILAGLLLATFSTSFMSANTQKLADPAEEKFCCYYVTSYETKKEGNCTVTYKVVTKYLFFCAIGSTRSVYSQTCSSVVPPKPNPDGNGGQNRIVK